LVVKCSRDKFLIPRNPKKLLVLDLPIDGEATTLVGEGASPW
jgi:hypothetical protein